MIDITLDGADVVGVSVTDAMDLLGFDVGVLVFALPDIQIRSAFRSIALGGAGHIFATSTETAKW
jgi:hypothetical protein